jgi:nucleotide-binding universal stress UspA family protein
MLILVKSAAAAPVRLGGLSDGGPAMFRNILVGYDGSEAAARAFAAAVELARAFGGQVRVVSVIAAPAMHLETGATLALEHEQAWATGSLAELTRDLHEGACQIETDLAWGPPAEALLDQARLHGADHIVLGRTGKGMVQRLLIGSVSRTVVDRAHIAVTLVP